MDSFKWLINKRLWSMVKGPVMGIIIFVGIVLLLTFIFIKKELKEEVKNEKK